MGDSIHRQSAGHACVLVMDHWRHNGCQQQERNWNGCFVVQSPTTDYILPNYSSSKYMHPTWSSSMGNQHMHIELVNSTQ